MRGPSDHAWRSGREEAGEAGPPTSPPSVVDVTPRTTPPAERRGSTRAPQQVVPPDARLPVDPPPKERTVEPQGAEIQGRPAEHLARAADRGLVVVDPELEAGAALAPVHVVGGGEPRVLDADRALLVEQRRPCGLVGVRGARRPDARERDPVAGARPGADRA